MAQQNKKSVVKQHLAVFDFDHTIIEENSDIMVRGLLSAHDMRALPKYQREWNCWTLYMQHVFRLMGEKNITEIAIRDVIKHLKPVPGMKNLIKSLKSQFDFDIIIISDANYLFIDQWLRSADLDKYVKNIFSNPATFVNGTLRIEMYHQQTLCTLSSKNLCKGDIMEEYVKSQRAKGVFYDHIVYIGDGRNDFCPILRLGAVDLGCLRSGYQCMRMVERTLAGDPPEDGMTTKYSIKAEILTWNSGEDILGSIFRLMQGTLQK